MGKLPRGGESAWHTLEAAEVLRALETDAESGLSNNEAARRLAEQGPNELEEKGGRGFWAILLEQFTSAMIVILIVAAVASALLGDHEDSIAIAVIVVLNAVLGFGQDYRAERAMAALKQLSAPTVRVLIRRVLRDEVSGEVLRCMEKREERGLKATARERLVDDRFPCPVANTTPRQVPRRIGWVPPRY